MIFRRIYNKEMKFILLCCTAIFIIVFGAVFTSFHTKRDQFQALLQNNNYRGLYSYIDSPGFSEQIFEKYMKYNFGDKVKVVSRNKKNDCIDYVLRGINRDINITLFKKNGRFVWLFDDYLYNWHIKLPKSAKVYIEGELQENRNGELTIERLPFAIYNVKTFFSNMETYNENLLAGQSIEIKMKLPDETINMCNDVIKKYLVLKETSINKKNIEGLETDFLDSNSGLFKEITDDIEWLKKQDYKESIKLISENITNAQIDNEDIICVDVEEKWDNTITYENNTSHEIKTNHSKYYIKSGQKYIITQIQTEQY